MVFKTALFEPAEWSFYLLCFSSVSNSTIDLLSNTLSNDCNGSETLHHIQAVGILKAQTPSRFIQNDFHFHHTSSHSLFEKCHLRGSINSATTTAKNPLRRSHTSGHSAAIHHISPKSPPIWAAPKAENYLPKAWCWWHDRSVNS